ncbi:MAG: reverse transcriptase domain-containing protein [Candidatus Thiodiazotropha sp.]
MVWELEEHHGNVSIGGRTITNLRFADDIDALVEDEQELEALIESLDQTYTRYKMTISAEKTKLMTNSAHSIQREIKVKGQKLGTATSFKNLGAIVSDKGSKSEVLSRIAQATAALTKLKPVRRDNNISLGSKVKLMRSLVMSIFLYACE